MSTSYDNWVYDQLQPEEQVYRRRPKKEPSTRAEIIASADKCPDRPVIDEAEQVRQEDEYLKMHGV